MIERFGLLLSRGISDVGIFIHWAFEGHGDEAAVVAPCRLIDILGSAGINDAFGSAAPVLQVCHAEQGFRHIQVVGKRLMRLFYILRRYLPGELSRTRNLNTVIVYGETDGEIMLLPPTVTESIDKSFPQCINRHFKMFLPFETFACDAATQRKVFETEINARLKEFEEIAFCALVIAEHILIRADKPCHPQPEVRILVNIL